MTIHIHPLWTIFIVTVIVFIVTGIGAYMTKKLTDGITKPKKLKGEQSFKGVRMKW